MVWFVRLALLGAVLLSPHFAFAKDPCEMSFAELTAEKAKLETRIAEASGPHIPPDRDAEAQLIKIENEIRRRNGLPPLPERAAVPAQIARPAPPIVAPQSEHDRKVTDLLHKISLLERKRAWIEEQDAYAAEPDPELKTVKQEIEALTKELQAELAKR